MRTTLTIDDDVLEAARAMADYQRRSVGEVVSELARKSLRTNIPQASTRNGFPLLPRRGATVTMEMVNALRDETP